ncbi:interleukin-12 receptor subunit beta-1 [Hemicordylus capensis]|uniref:interleukin-12 receptor subunit beta-1 n=1 Tax=Hemicordylus capensis TaxID=884348 RepID=UPI0023022D2C|nr:interleukin-12 receptor subunit beta-1 [Hemicordylus capensis]
MAGAPPAGKTRRGGPQAGGGGGGSLPARLLLLLVAVRLAAPEMLRGGPEEDVGATWGPRNLRCHKPCCRATFLCLLTCSWEAGKSPGADHTLYFWYHEEETKQKKWAFQAGKNTFFQLNQDRVYALKNATIWVESRVPGGPRLTSENLTLQISEALKFDPPPSGSIRLSRSGSILTLTLPDLHDCRSSPMKKEARVRPRGGTAWTLAGPLPKAGESITLCSSERGPVLQPSRAPAAAASRLLMLSVAFQGNCSSDEDDRATRRLQVTCYLGENLRYEVQVRYQTSHWSSDWSDWSGSVWVPAEILQSPKVNVTVEPLLGQDGLRNVTLEWEKPSVEQGDVSYSLTLVLLPCACEKDQDTFQFQDGTQFAIDISGAGYHVSLVPFNKAGAPLATSFLLPPAQDAAPGAGFLNLSLAGGRFTLEWEAQADDVEFYCLEKQQLGQTPTRREPCVEEAQAARSGAVEPNKCYRLAVHGFLPERGSWATLGFTHLFSRNASLEDSIRIKVTSQSDSVVVQWEPPQDLAACPGALKKYVICCRALQDSDVMYYEANASETHYTIQGLQPKTAYQVGVWASTTWNEGACRAHLLFATSPPDPRQKTVARTFLSLGVLLGFLLAMATFHCGKKRVKKVLCPALPTPANAEAVKILTSAETAQVKPLQDFLEPLESSSPPGPLSIEVLPDEEEEEEEEEEAAAETRVDPPGLLEAAEGGPPLPKEGWAGSDDALPSEYKGQGLLSPPEEDRPRGGGEGAGASPEVGAHFSLLPAGQGLPLVPAPLSFRLWDQLVMLQSGDPGAGSPCPEGASSAEGRLLLAPQTGLAGSRVKPAGGGASGAWLAPDRRTAGSGRDDCMD